MRLRDQSSLQERSPMSREVSVYIAPSIPHIHGENLMVQLARYRANSMMRFRPYAQAAMRLYRNAYSVSKRQAPVRRGYQTSRGNSTRGTDGSGVTTQYDKKTIYYKRRMPRYKKRQWIRFSRKVNAVLEKGLGTKTCLFNTPVTDVNPVGGQGVITVGFYAQNGLADLPGNNYAGLKDIHAMMSNDPMNLTGKMKFKSGILDVTFQAETDNTVGLELDIYELVFNGKTSPYTNVNAMFVQAAAVTQNISGAGTGLTITTRGCTPFDLPEVFSIGHFSVQKKVKYLLPPGNTCTYQIRDPKMYILNKEDVLDQISMNCQKKGVTRVLYAIFKPVVSGAAQVRLNAGVTRKYSYHVTESNTTQDQLLP